SPRRGWLSRTATDVDGVDRRDDACEGAWGRGAVRHPAAAARVAAAGDPRAATWRESPARRRPLRKLRERTRAYGVRLLRGSVPARPGAARRRHGGDERLPGFRARIFLALRERAVEHRRVRPPPARPRRSMDDGAAARARRPLSGRVARGRREPRDRTRLGPEGGGVAARGVPLRAGPAGGVLPAHGRSARPPDGVGRRGTPEPASCAGFLDSVAIG